MQCKSLLIFILQFHVDDEQRSGRRGIRQRDLRAEVEIDRPVRLALVLRPDGFPPWRDVRQDRLRPDSFVGFCKPFIDNILHINRAEFLHAQFEDPCDDLVDREEAFRDRILLCIATRKRLRHLRRLSGFLHVTSFIPFWNLFIIIIH